MCNLYSLSQDAIRRLFRIARDLTGNLPGLPAVYPDTMAPVARVARDGKHELSIMLWRFLPPPNLGTAPVTNVRGLSQGVRSAIGRRSTNSAHKQAERIKCDPQVSPCKFEPAYCPSGNTLCTLSSQIRKKVELS